MSERAGSTVRPLLPPSLSAAVPRVCPMAMAGKTDPCNAPRETGNDRMTNFAELLASVTEAAPARPALKLGERTWTYGELDDAIARVAGVLSGHGVGPGDRVALQ